MIRVSPSLIMLVAVCFPLTAQNVSWTKKLKDKDKPNALHDSSQHVRGDSGKWSENAKLLHAPPRPAKTALDVWADRLLKKKHPVTQGDDNWLIFRSKQLDDNDRVWIDEIIRDGNRFTVVAKQAKWQGKYFRNFTYYEAIGVNLGKLNPGKYEVHWIIKPMVFKKFDGDGRPRGNWPKDARAVDKKSSELRLAFTVEPSDRKK